MAKVPIRPLSMTTVLRGPVMGLAAQMTSKVVLSLPACLGALVDDGHARRDFQAEHFLFREPVQMHDDAAKRVSVGRHKDVLAPVDGGNENSKVASPIFWSGQEKEGGQC